MRACVCLFGSLLCQDLAEEGWVLAVPPNGTPVGPAILFYFEPNPAPGTGGGRKNADGVARLAQRLLLR